MYPAGVFIFQNVAFRFEDAPIRVDREELPFIEQTHPRAKIFWRFQSICENSRYPTLPKALHDHCGLAFEDRD